MAMRLAQFEQNTPFARVGGPVDLFLFVHGPDPMGQVITEDDDVADVVVLIRVNKSEGRLESRASVNKVISDARQACDQTDPLRFQRMLVFGKITTAGRIAKNF